MDQNKKFKIINYTKNLERRVQYIMSRMKLKKDLNKWDEGLLEEIVASPDSNAMFKNAGITNDKNQWNEAQQRGIKIINTKFDKEQLTHLFFRFIDEVFSNLEQHRNNNFTGKMLMHHSLQSSKYMSKWIQEKNRKNRL